MRSPVSLPELSLRSAGNKVDARLDPIDHVFGRRCAGRQSNGISAVEPFGTHLCFRLDVVDAGAVARTRPQKLARVVARPAADNDHYVSLLRHLDRSGLPLLGGL